MPRFLVSLLGGRTLSAEVGEILKRLIDAHREG
jgi:hypothetical protein